MSFCDLSIDQELHIGWTKTWGPDNEVKANSSPYTKKQQQKDKWIESNKGIPTSWRARGERNQQGYRLLMWLFLVLFLFAVLGIYLQGRLQ